MLDGVFYGIGEEVGEYLFYRFMVEQAGIAFRLRAEIHLYPLAVRIYLEQGENAAEKTHQISGYGVECQFVALDLAEGQQLPYHALDAGYVPFYMVRVLARGRILRQALLKLVKGIYYERQGRLEVVGDVGEEIDPGPCQFLHVLLLQLLQFQFPLIYLLVGEVLPDKVGDGR